MILIGLSGYGSAVPFVAWVCSRLRRDEWGIDLGTIVISYWAGCVCHWPPAIGGFGVGGNRIFITKRIPGLGELFWR
jgi:hypothetical protein